MLDANTVRGFDEGVISGDHGYATTIEYHWPWFGSAMGYVFVDHGGVKPYEGNNEPRSPEEYLTGLGIGLNWQLGRSTHLHIDYGQPVGLEGATGLAQFRVQMEFEKL